VIQVDSFFGEPLPWRPACRGPAARRSQAQLCRLLEAAVAASFAVPPESLRERSRCTADVAFARQAAMYLAHVACGLTYTAIGRSFRRDRTTAAHACRLVEERRDDPVLDRQLNALEIICADLAATIRAAAEVRA
jgi:chromosomal replication initiation ATPase DnaA